MQRMDYTRRRQGVEVCPKCGRKASARRYPARKDGKASALFIHRSHVVEVAGVALNVVDDGCMVLEDAR